MQGTQAPEHEKTLGFLAPQLRKNGSDGCLQVSHLGGREPPSLLLRGELVNEGIELITSRGRMPRINLAHAGAQCGGQLVYCPWR